MFIAKYYEVNKWINKYNKNISFNYIISIILSAVFHMANYSLMLLFYHDTLITISTYEILRKKKDRKQ